MTDFETARFNMVESQIRTNDITDPALLKAFQTVPREAFVPASVEAIAYMDEDLCVQPAAEGRAARYLMEPRVFAKLVQAAEITDSDLVLDVGCATGYSAAILARVADAVVAVEADEELAAKAGETLLAQSVDNAAVVVGKLQDGCAKQGPFDVIVLSGSVEVIPDAFFSQLKEGGRLVAVIVTGKNGTACRFDKTAAGVTKQVLFDAYVGALPGFGREPAFTF